MEQKAQSTTHDQDGPLVGRTPARRAPLDVLVKRHRNYLEAQITRADGSRPVKQVVLSEAYAASVVSIHEVEIIPLSRLQIETHHRGQGLVVQTATPAYCGVGSVSIVVDADGSADKIAIYNHGDTSILSNLPAGLLIAVKEPYYKYNGRNDYMICVDHPSDVVILRPGDPIVPLELARRDGGIGLIRKTPEEWRDAGDAAFIQRDYPTAAFCYTEALEEEQTTHGKDNQGKDIQASFRAGVLSKRAGTNLLLGRYDAAQNDALASRRGEHGDWRAYFTAARAAYGLCHYLESRTLFEQALAAVKAALGTGRASEAQQGQVQQAYERCLARVREETEGESAYDFWAMYRQKQVHVDCASYLRRTEVRRSALHGNGLFAAEPIAAGEVVFIEKAAFLPIQYEEPARASAALYATMVRQMYDNPSVAAEVLPLFAGDEAERRRTGKEGTLVDGVPVVDVFLAENIRVKNCFSAPLSTLDHTRQSIMAQRGRGTAEKTADKTSGMAKGLWRHASYLNHSCVPNTMRSFLGDVLISRASRDIAAGDEICQQYIPVRADWLARQEELRDGWGFTCACPLCAAEAAGSARMSSFPDPLHERRRVLLAAIEHVAAQYADEESGGHHVTNPEAVETVRHFHGLLEALQDKVPAAVHGQGHPRLALVYPTMWLLHAYYQDGCHEKAARYAAKTLRCFGFGTPPIHGSKSDVAKRGAALYADRQAVSLHTIHVVLALKMGAEAHRALGQTMDADAWEEAARFGYRIVTGFEDDISSLA